MQRQIVDCSTALESKLPAQPERAHQRTCNSPSTREASGAAHAASPAEGVFHGHSLMHGRCSIMSAHLSAGHCQMISTFNAVRPSGRRWLTQHGYKSCRDIHCSLPGMMQHVTQAANM